MGVSDVSSRAFSNSKWNGEGQQNKKKSRNIELSRKDVRAILFND
jgi:hypothetical protein